MTLAKPHIYSHFKQNSVPARFFSWRVARNMEFLTLNRSTKSFACLLSPLPLTLKRRIKSTNDTGKLDGRRYSDLCGTWSVSRVGEARRPWSWARFISGDQPVCCKHVSRLLGVEGTARLIGQKLGLERMFFLDIKPSGNGFDYWVQALSSRPRLDERDSGRPPDTDGGRTREEDAHIQHFGSSTT